MTISDHARALQRDSVIFRGHADVYELVQRGLNGEKAPIYDSWYPRLSEAFVDAVVLAVSGDSMAHRNGDMRCLHGALKILDQVLSEIEGNPTLQVIRTPADVPSAPDGKLRFLLTLEGGKPLEGEPANLRHFYRLGIRLLQPTHNLRNELADGGFEEETNGRLSRFGVQVIKECNRLGIVVDLAHLAEAGFWHVLEIAEKPVIVSHGNAKKVHDIKRNLSDEQLKAIARQGGIAGLLFLPNYLQAGPPTTESMLKMLQYMLDLIGPECVAIGHLGLDKPLVQTFANINAGVYNGYRKTISQFADGGVTDAYQYGVLIEGMLQMGFKDREIAGVLGGNWARVLKDNL